ncbi:NACHT, LRR and PYD domains-containing protein 1 homolog [Pimephales promelas]|uniref:NACHT, LRR and PYD domains-containing protein 1 homolog n=1 Tax=Pimephales promelas TaxID=90988 RepID=UPI0019555210|nr:NACHT, LRR and PYD domains-containing protein 1 homolog [Pimephales promelas]XP_039550910.1 NACHT, LRR and PYD domains-containing protein 1 homolog [Pimephales promelas]KAG1939591.1 NACHT, LRR and PYD domains-containing protein [Pimephales promelas]KAG1939592.1 NACHT, LRR and PYD domains-containing protein [Pimephales promelas]
MDTFYKSFSKKNFSISSSHSDSGPNVSASAQSGSHITTPVLTNNAITGNVHIIHNAPGFTLYRPPSEKTQTLGTRSVILKYKKLICSEHQCVTEYNSRPGEHVLLSERYTQPLIIQKHRDPKEREEEICSSGESFQRVLSSRSSDDSVHLNSLFDPDSHGISPSAVILQGNSGNGKSFTVQKIMMDWASGDLYKERYDIVFHLKCKEINRIPGKKSLVEILSYSCSLTSDQISQMLQQSSEKVLFIIDGFDELRLTEDIYGMSPNTDPLQKAPPVVILCDLLRGRILPESFLLVTSRSTATDTLSKLLKGPQRFSEIMGFSEKGIEEYFQKFFQNEELFRKAYTLVKTNETLITACSIPVVCWIICTTIKQRFKSGADVTSGLETTTSIYVDFVCTLLEHHCQGLSQSVPTLLRSLGQLAERGMLEQQVLLDEKTVNETVSDPAGNPFLCKFLFKRTIRQETMFSFMHLSFQEFFTALYYVLLGEKESQRKCTQLFSIDRSSDDRFTAVMQFAFGLLNKDVRCTLQRHGLFVHPKTQAHLKELILKELCCEYLSRLFPLQCLYELHEEDFVKEALEAMNTVTVYGPALRRTDCWALMYCAQCCQCIEELALYDCRLTSEKLLMILPVLHKFKNLELGLEGVSSDSDLTELMCALTREQTLSSHCFDVSLPFTNSGTINLSISKELSSIHILLPWWEGASLRTLNLGFPKAGLIDIDWTRLSQTIHSGDTDVIMSVLLSFSNLKKMEMSVRCLSKMWSAWTLQIMQNCFSLTELVVKADFLLEEEIKILQRSRRRPACIVTFQGYMCNKQSQKCTHLNDSWLSCNQEVKIHLNSQGFSMETLRKPLFMS